MFGFHWAELLIVLALAVVVFGPKRLPEIGGSLGRGIRDFRKGVTDFKEETGYNEIRSLPNDIAAAMTEPVRPAPQAPDSAPRQTAGASAQAQGPTVGAS